MSEEKTKTVSVQVPEDEIIEAVVCRIVGGEYRDEDDDTWSPASRFADAIRKKVEVLVEKRVSAALGDIVDEVIRAKVEPLVEAACAEGFHSFNEYGQRTTTEKFDIYVRRSVDEMFKKPGHGYRKAAGAEMAEKAFRDHVELAFKGEVEAVRKKVREYVDAQLGGAVLESLRAALGLKR